MGTALAFHFRCCSALARRNRKQKIEALTEAANAVSFFMTITAFRTERALIIGTPLRKYEDALSAALGQLRKGWSIGTWSLGWPVIVSNLQLKCGKIMARTLARIQFRRFH